MAQTTKTPAAEIETRECLCGHEASTHVDAARPLAYCIDCGKATCPECRAWDRCLACAQKKVT